MPKFQLQYGSPEAQQRFNALDAFTQGYIEAMFFTADEELNEPRFEELSESAMTILITDCLTFQERAGRSLATAYAAGYEPEQAGRDFWFTRNGHGVGFWSRDLLTDLTPQEPMVISDHLTEEADRFGECDLYLGDDGELYLC